LPEYAIDYYIHLYNRNVRALRATFGVYRAWLAHIDQDKQRSTRPLRIPVLGIGGENSWGSRPGDAMTLAAKHVHSVVIAGVGHWVAETAPKRMARLLTSFFAPHGASS
jgi:pimeloyl-ACP methyl ester carboxylesterase